MYSNEWTVYFVMATGMITIVFWFKTQFMDPGFIEKPKQVDFLVSLTL